MKGSRYGVEGAAGTRERQNAVLPAVGHGSLPRAASRPRCPQQPGQSPGTFLPATDRLQAEAAPWWRSCPLAQPCQKGNGQQQKPDTGLGLPQVCSHPAPEPAPETSTHPCSLTPGHEQGVRRGPTPSRSPRGEAGLEPEHWSGNHHLLLQSLTTPEPEHLLGTRLCPH